MISLEEFEDACSLLGMNTKNAISKHHVHDMVNAIDQNKDGYIDFNEFLEAFRIVNNLRTPVQWDRTLGVTQLDKP